jgi:Rad3-related DNA helicase
MSLSEQEVLKAFPAVKYRKYQKESILKIADAFNSGIKCVLLDAPTGYGKSVVNATFCRLMKSFYATPQLTLIDQIRADKSTAKYFTEIKGRQNYYCYHEPSRTCNIGVCKQYKDFKCSKAEVCPYWIQKLKALESNSVLMSFAYFILEGKTDTAYSFGRRKLLVLDESHSIDRYVLNHVNLVVAPYTIPYSLYEMIRNEIPKEIKTLDELKLFIKTVLELAKNENEKYAYEQMTLNGLSLGRTIAKIKLDDFVSKARTFFDSLSETEWVWQVDYTTYKGIPSKRVIAQPLYSRLFMRDMVWNRADLFIISSATILDSGRFIREVGLDRALKFKEILHLRVPSTFPVKNRPIIDVSVGKMTRTERKANIPKGIEMLEGIIEVEKGKNVAVHARSYEFAKAIEKGLADKYKPLLITHTSEDREDALTKWKNSKGKVFICVAFTEGQDWKYDICRAQVLFKVPYPDLRDRRVARRLELKQWNWYYDTTLKETIQSYGRAVRSEYDKARFYVIDTSFWGLINRGWKQLPAWFKEALPLERNKDIKVKRR